MHNSNDTNINYNDDVNLISSVALQDLLHTGSNSAHKTSVILIDVREYDERLESKIENSIHIPLSNFIDDLQRNAYGDSLIAIVKYLGMMSDRECIGDIDNHSKGEKIDESHIDILDTAIVLYCRSGKRSAYAARYFSSIYPEYKSVYSLDGGMLAWSSSYPSLQDVS